MAGLAFLDSNKIVEEVETNKLLEEAEKVLAESDIESIDKETLEVVKFGDTVERILNTDIVTEFKNNPATKKYPLVPHNLHSNSIYTKSQKHDPKRKKVKLARKQNLKRRKRN